MTMVRKIEEDASASIIPECWTNSLPLAIGSQMLLSQCRIHIGGLAIASPNITLSCSHVAGGSAVSEGARNRLDRDSGFLVHVLPRINKPSHLRGR